MRASSGGSTSISRQLHDALLLDCDPRSDLSLIYRNGLNPRQFSDTFVV